MIYFINFIEQLTDNGIKGSVEVYPHHHPFSEYKPHNILDFDFQNEKEYYRLKEKWDFKEVTENQFEEFKREMKNEN